MNLTIEVSPQYWRKFKRINRHFRLPHSLQEISEYMLNHANKVNDPYIADMSRTLLRVPRDLVLRELAAMYLLEADISRYRYEELKRMSEVEFSYGHLDKGERKICVDCAQQFKEGDDCIVLIRDGKIYACKCLHCRGKLVDVVTIGYIFKRVWKFIWGSK